MFKKWVGVLVVGLVLAFSACSKNKSTGSGTGEDGTGGISDEDLTLQNQRYGEGSIPRATEDGPFPDIHFEFNSAQVPSDAMADLEQHAKVIRGDSALKVEIEGHCDKRGTSEFNLALGERRAKAVASQLSRYGAPASQLSIVSYGEEIPLDSADNEDAYARNRRVHFAVFKR